MNRLFKKRQNVFLKLIHDQAALTLEGLDALKTFLSTQDPAASALLTTNEKEADEARRILIDELNKTFITPFDREDIFALSRTIDDVLDYAYSTVSEMEVLKVKATPFMQRMAALLRDGNRLDEARSYLHKAIRLRPTYPDAYYNLAIEVRA